MTHIYATIDDVEEASAVLIKSIAIAVITLTLVEPVEALSTYSPGRWKFGESTNGDLAAEISTDVGHGLQVHLAFLCNDGGRYSYIGHSGGPDTDTPEAKEFIDSYTDGDLRIETYRSGMRTNSFRPTGFHEGEGDEVTDVRLRALQEADFILIVGAKRPVALPAANARIAVAQYIAACGILKQETPQAK